MKLYIELQDECYQVLKRAKDESAYSWANFFERVVIHALQQEIIPKVKNIRITKSRSEFDFIALYQKYPRKVGKTAGIKRCEAQIKTPEDYALLSQAIDSYVEYLKKEGTEPKFVKHFSTFMSEWRDFLDRETGNNSLKKRSVLDEWQEYYLATKKG
jgi:hypothetical protein